MREGPPVHAGGPLCQHPARARSWSRMHVGIDQHLGDGIAEAVAVEDTDQPVDRSGRIAIVLVGQRHHGEIVASVRSARPGLGLPS